MGRGRVHRVRSLAGLVAWRGAERVGFAIYRVDGEECELVSLDGLEHGRGVGTALLREVDAEARRAGRRGLWLIRANDNLEALRFYQRRGFRLSALHVGAVQTSRMLKPGIPEMGAHGIPVREELELDLALEEAEVG